jgi:hypothetical protein
VDGSGSVDGRYFEVKNASYIIGRGVLLFVTCCNAEVESHTLYYLTIYAEPGSRIRYSDWLWAERTRGRSSSRGGVKISLFSTSSRPAVWSTQPPIRRVTGALSPGVKQPESKAAHSTPASAEVKKSWICTSLAHTLSWRST